MVIIINTYNRAILATYIEHIFYYVHVFFPPKFPNFQSLKQGNIPNNISLVILPQKIKKNDILSLNNLKIQAGDNLLG